MSSMISSISSQLTSNIFSKVDTKKQGYIEQSDLTDVLSKMSGSDDSTDATELFKSMDSDSDGKVTKSEMTTNIENLLSQLSASSTQSSNGVQGGMPPPDGPPPPDGAPPGDMQSGGVTKEQATEMAANTDDEKLSSLMTQVAENFEAADANEDGKVSQDEAMKYAEESKQTANTQSQSQEDKKLSMMMKLSQLVEAYGLSSESSSTIATTV